LGKDLEVGYQQSHEISEVIYHIKSELSELNPNFKISEVTKEIFRLLKKVVEEWTDMSY